MTIQYTNRKGQIYYLCQGTTRNGKNRYFFSTKKKEELLDDIPGGFEIYENPVSAQVFLLKKEDPLVTDLEKQLVISSLKKNQNVDHFIVDVRKNYITIYIADDVLDPNDYPAYIQENILRSIHKFLHYAGEMRFGLVDIDKRYFVAERFCYRGAVDDWITISAPERLNKLVDKFVRHLGQQSFYELFPY